MMLRLRHCLCVLTIATLTSCSMADFTDAGSVPSTQEWLLIDNDANIGGGIRTFTNLTIDKGGAISQGSGVYSVAVTNNCSYTVPLSGNWSGTAVRITSTGGACGVGYILTMTGTSDDVYGKGASMSGTYQISYSGGFSGVDKGTWKASFTR